MKQKEEKWAIFWCDLLSSIIYSDIEPEQNHQKLKELSSKAVLFPDGETKRPSPSTLKRKLAKYRKGGFHGLYRKRRKDTGKARVVSDEVIAKAIELKKEQPFRSDRTINHILQEKFGITIARSTLYWHFKEAGATRLKLGVVKKKVRGRWSRDHTHDFWQGDFEREIRAEGKITLDQLNTDFRTAFNRHLNITKKPGLFKTQIQDCIIQPRNILGKMIPGNRT